MVTLLQRWRLLTPPFVSPTSCFLAEPGSGGAGAEPLPSCAVLSTTSLEHPQTSPEVDDAALARGYASDDLCGYCPFPHTGWKDTRRRVMECIAESGGGSTRVLRFRQCGEDVWVYHNASSGDWAFRHNHCGDRFCMVCGALRSRRISDALEARIADIDPIFMTFTVRGKTSDKLPVLLKTLSGAFTAIRQTPLWKKSVRGGAAFLEVKYSQDGGGHWHPHFHVVADSRYIEVGWLSQLWKTLTGGSSQVHISRVRDKGKVKRYVTKYASKPMDSSFTKDKHLLMEAMRALKGKRLCACFGSWYRTPLSEEVEDEEPPIFTEWRCVGRIGANGPVGFESEKFASDVLAKVERYYKLFGLRHHDG